MYIFCLLILRKKLLLVMFLFSLATCFHIPFVKDGNNKKPSHKRATLDREAKLQQNMNIIIQKRRRRNRAQLHSDSWKASLYSYPILSLSLSLSRSAKLEQYLLLPLCFSNTPFEERLQSSFSLSPPFST